MSDFMFSSFPPVPHGFQGLGSSGSLIIESSIGRSEEVFDFMPQLHELLNAAGHVSTVCDDWLVLTGSGLHVRPELFEVSSPQEGGVRSSTVIAAAHPTCIPEGVFEFQHALGENLQTAVLSGFEGWLSLDLPVLLGALGEISTLNEMIMDFTDPMPRRRRIVLGDVLHYASYAVNIPEAHSFCPCCMMTHCMEAFAQEIRRDTFLGIRLLAARDQDGRISADCRINGQDFPPGHAALTAYAATWPQRGFEMRKQYVAVHTLKMPVLH